MAKGESMQTHKKYTGVLWRESEAKRYGGRPDRCYYIKYLDPQTHKQVKAKVGWASEGYTPEMAQKRRTEAIEGSRNEVENPPEAAPMTLDALAAEYMPWAEANKKDKGYQDRNRYKNHLQPKLGKKQLTEITLKELEDLRTKLAKKLQPQTIAHVFKLLKAMYNKAVLWSYYSGKNPVTGLKSKPLNNSRVRYLTHDEARRLFEALEPHPLVHSMALLSLGAGMRFGEVAKLTWQDINFVNETALIRDGKGGTDRHAQIKGIVKQMLEQRRDSVENGTSGLIFPNSNGERFSTIPRQYEQAVEAVGLNDNSTDTKDKVVFHTLRHTFASWLAIRGTPLYTIQRLLGHKSIKMTERYAHLCPDVQATAVEGMLKEFGV